MSDSVETVLRQSPIMPAQRADLFDAYQAAGNEDDLAKALGPLKVPNTIKAKLWDLKAGTAPPEAKAPAEPAPYVPDISDPNSLGFNAGAGPGSIPVSMDPKMEAGATAAGLGMALGGPAAAPAALRVAGSPVGAAVVGGALNYAHTGSIVSAGEAALRDGLLARFVPGALGAILPRSLLARMTHGLAQAAVAEMPAAAAAVAPAVAEAAPAAYQGIPSMLRIAAPVAEDAAAAANAASAAGGASRMAAMARAVPAAQAAAPIAQAATEAVPAAGDAAESLLQTRLRASVLLKENPAALAEEIASKVVSLKQGAGKGLSAAQIGTSLEDIYGLPKAAAKNMVTMIFQTHGLK